MAVRRIRDPLELEPLWRRVERNRLRLILFVAGFVAAGALAAVVLLVLSVGSLLLILSALALRFVSFEVAESIFGVLTDPGRFLAAAATLGALFSAAYALRVLRQPLRRQLSALGAFSVPKGEMLETKNALKDMAIAAGVDPAPELFCLDSSAVNAFLVGRGGERPLCVVTRGLAERFDVGEQRAVFANLLARYLAGDILWATAVSALMAPLWRWRDRGVSAGAGRPDESAKLLSYLAGDARGAAYASTPVRARCGAGGGEVVLLGLWAIVVYALAVAVSEMVAVHHRRTQLLSAEVADSEGMLLLKDPSQMLRALDKAVRADNRIMLAMPLYSMLFYIWAGDDLVDDDDPEWKRLARLREIVGVEGIADADREAAELVEESLPAGHTLPVAPRLESPAPAEPFVAPPPPRKHPWPDKPTSPLLVAAGAFGLVGLAWTCLIMTAAGSDPRLIWLVVSVPVVVALVAGAVRSAWGRMR